MRNISFCKYNMTGGLVFLLASMSNAFAGGFDERPAGTVAVPPAIVGTITIVPDDEGSGSQHTFEGICKGVPVDISTDSPKSVEYWLGKDDEGNYHLEGEYAEGAHTLILANSNCKPPMFTLGVEIQSVGTVKPIGNGAVARGVVFFFVVPQ